LTDQKQKKELLGEDSEIALSDTLGQHRLFVLTLDCHLLIGRKSRRHQLCWWIRYLWPELTWTDSEDDVDDRRLAGGHGRRGRGQVDGRVVHPGGDVVLAAVPAVVDVRAGGEAGRSEVDWKRHLRLCWPDDAVEVHAGFDCPWLAST